MTQFQFSKNLINPAFAGHTEDFSASLQNRTQWSSLPGKFNAQALNVNVGCPVAGLGFGFQLLNQVEGEGLLRSTESQFQLSYNIPGEFNSALGSSMRGNDFIISAGLQIGMGQKFIDNTQLTFSDQFSNIEGFLNRPSAARVARQTDTYFDLSAGLRTQFEIDRDGTFVSLGGSIFHIARNEASFLGAESEIPRRLTLHGFTYFKFKRFKKDPRYFSVGMISNFQSNLQSHTLLLYQDFFDYLQLGLGYRRQRFLMVGEELTALMLPVLAKFQNIQLSYSYDFTLSSLKNDRTFGTHEFGLFFKIDGKHLCPNSGRRKLECYDFKNN